MRSRARWIGGAAAVVTASAVAVASRDRCARRWAGRLTRRLRSGSRRTEWRLEHWLERALLGEDPEPPDDVVAERVRADLGPVTKALDLPHVHVHVERHVAILHGDVGTADEARAVEDATRQVPGVAGIESHLHVGFVPGDTRPSAGRQPSPQLHRLVEAARRHGGGEATALVAVGAVLGTFASTLPDRALERLRSHVPPDIAALLAVPRRSGDVRIVVSADQLVDVLSDTGLVSEQHAEHVLTHVLAELRAILPEDADALTRALPAAIRPLWAA